MKKVSIHLLSNIILLLAGLLLIVFHSVDHVLDKVACIIGAAFVLPSLVYLVMVAMRKAAEKRAIDFMGILPATGGVCFGLVMLLKPALFNGVLAMLLGMLLVVLGLFHIIYLLLSKKTLSIRLWYYLSPLLVLIAGVIILVTDWLSGKESVMVLISGCALVLFNFTSLQEYLAERKYKKSLAAVNDASQDEIAEDKDEEIPKSIEI